MTEKTTAPANATAAKAKMITLLALVAFVVAVFTFTILKFAKVW